MKRSVLFCLFVALSWVIILSCSSRHPCVIIQTKLGDIRVEIFTEAADLTAQNFLAYVDANAYEGATFYRSVTMANQPDNDVKIEVIQGGLREDDRMLPPIEHQTTEQTGVRHRDGVISMARNEPGSATSEFFICVGNQPELDYGGKRNPDGQGFAAFGRVVAGMEIVHRIHRWPVVGQRITPPIRIHRIVRADP
jgi:peptidyl-prolyl cis-trans isomerase A (cyclophilin A)